MSRRFARVLALTSALALAACGDAGSVAGPPEAHTPMQPRPHVLRADDQSDPSDQTVSQRAQTKRSRYAMAAN